MAFTTLESSTLQNYAPTLADNVFRNHPLLEALTRKGNVKFQDGGRTIVKPIMTGTNGTVASFAGYDAISLTAQTGMTAAEYPWTQNAGSVIISGIEETQNRGKSAAFNLLKAKVRQLELSFKNAISTQIYSDGSGNSGKDIDGLAAMVDDSSTYGGLAPGTFTTWKSIVDAPGVDTDLTLGDLDHVYNLASDDNGVSSPTFEITTQDLWEAYSALLQPQVRYSDPATADAGFRNLTHRGVPVVWDRGMTAKFWYMLNLDHLEFWGDTENWFKMTPFVETTVNGVNARLALMLLFGNLATDERRRHAVLKSRVPA